MSSEAENVKDACAEAARTGPEHESLARFEGTWKAEVRIWMNPQGEPHVSTGVMKNRMVLGGRFLEEDYQDDAGMFAGKGFWGYNHVDQCYEGFWVDSMATFFHLEQGWHDSTQDVYIMTGTLTNPSDRKQMRKRSVITYKRPDEHTMEMFFTLEDGREMKSMEIIYKRA